MNKQEQRTKDKQAAVDAYRAAAAKLFGASEVEQEVYIKHPEEDPGEWAPRANVIIYLEPDMRRRGDEGKIPNALDYWSPNGFGNALALGEAVGDGSYVEYINAAVAAVW
ncbi:MAG: hypothetical protein AB7L09_01920 [Nitrospira sp.]